MISTSVAQVSSPLPTPMPVSVVALPDCPTEWRPGREPNSFLGSTGTAAHRAAFLWGGSQRQYKISLDISFLFYQEILPNTIRENIQSLQCNGSSGPAANSTFVLVENRLVSSTHMAAHNGLPLQCPLQRPLLVPTGTAHNRYIDIYSGNT